MPKGGRLMSIKYKNDKGLNEKKSTQAAMNIKESDIDEQLKRSRFGDTDQDQTEERAGEQGATSGESFDKNVTKQTESEL